jgi:chromosome segregation ATPase
MAERTRAAGIREQLNRIEDLLASVSSRLDSLEPPVTSLASRVYQLREEMHMADRVYEFARAAVREQIEREQQLAKRRRAAARKKRTRR